MQITNMLLHQSRAIQVRRYSIARVKMRSEVTRVFLIYKEHRKNCVFWLLTRENDKIRQKMPFFELTILGPVPLLPRYRDSHTKYGRNELHLRFA